MLRRNVRDQIHEGGELGYSLSHSFGAVLDDPDFIVACVVGDGEAETGPLATAWHSNKFLGLQENEWNESNGECGLNSHGYWGFEVS